MNTKINPPMITRIRQTEDSLQWVNEATGEIVEAATDEDLIDLTPQRGREPVEPVKQEPVGYVSGEYAEGTQGQTCGNIYRKPTDRWVRPVFLAPPPASREQEPVGPCCGGDPGCACAACARIRKALERERREWKGLVSNMLSALVMHTFGDGLERIDESPVEEVERRVSAWNKRIFGERDAAVSNAKALESRIASQAMHCQNLQGIITARNEEIARLRKPYRDCVGCDEYSLTLTKTHQALGSKTGEKVHDVAERVVAERDAAVARAEKAEAELASAEKRIEELERDTKEEVARADANAVAMAAANRRADEACARAEKAEADYATERERIAALNELHAGTVKELQRVSSVRDQHFETAQNHAREITRLQAELAGANLAVEFQTKRAESAEAELTKLNTPWVVFEGKTRREIPLAERINELHAEIDKERIRANAAESAAAISHSAAVEAQRKFEELALRDPPLYQTINERDEARRKVEELTLQLSQVTEAHNELITSTAGDKVRIWELEACVDAWKGTSADMEKERDAARTLCDNARSELGLAQAQLAARPVAVPCECGDHCPCDCDCQCHPVNVAEAEPLPYAIPPEYVALSVAAAKWVEMPHSNKLINELIIASAACNGAKVSPLPYAIPPAVQALIDWAKCTSDGHTAYDPGKCPCGLCSVVRALSAAPYRCVQGEVVAVHHGDGSANPRISVQLPSLEYPSPCSDVTKIVTLCWTEAPKGGE